MRFSLQGSLSPRAGPPTLLAGGPSSARLAAPQPTPRGPPLPCPAAACAAGASGPAVGPLLQRWGASRASRLCARLRCLKATKTGRPSTSWRPKPQKLELLLLLPPRSPNWGASGCCACKPRKCYFACATSSETAGRWLRPTLTSRLCGVSWCCRLAERNSSPESTRWAKHAALSGARAYRHRDAARATHAGLALTRPLAAGDSAAPRVRSRPR